MKNIITIALALVTIVTVHAQGNHVFSGAEAANFGSIDLATPGGQTWSTDRTATPGYFSIVGTAAFTAASDASNVNGYVKKYGNQAFIFPVGTGTDLRTLAMSAPTSATDAYASAWILGNPTSTADVTNADALHSTTAVAGTIKSVMPIGQWDWQALSGTGVGLSITASMPNLTSFAPRGNLRLVGWSNATSKWIDLSNADNATGVVENSSITGTMVAGIDAISIGSISNGFPDLTPTTKISNATFTAIDGTTRDLVIDVNEILGNITDYTTKNIQVRVEKLSNFTYSYDPTITSVNVPTATTVQNPLWDLVSNTSSSMTFQLKTGNNITGLTKLSFSISMKVVTSAAPASYIVNVAIIPLSGAEIVTNNNYILRIVNIQ